MQVGKHFIQAFTRISHIGRPGGPLAEFPWGSCGERSRSRGWTIEIGSLI